MSTAANEPAAQRKPRPTLWRVDASPPTIQSIQQSVIRHAMSSLGRDEFSLTLRDRYHALCLAVRDELIKRWVNTQQTYYQLDVKRVYYLSMEFLTGRVLHHALVNLKLLDEFKTALDQMGYDLGELEELGIEPGLGNGGLGRLAACFIDSSATLEYPVYGYGLRYTYGIFRQRIDGTRQAEEPDDWLRLPNPWEIPRPERSVRVHFGGRVQIYTDDHGRLRHRWTDTHDVIAEPFDTPIPGYGNNTVNTLRLWHAHGTQDFDLEDFNAGDYMGAVANKVQAENITKVLYPSDSVYAGQELRLRQQYFLVAATLHDALRRHLTVHPSLDNLSDKVVFQLNDTHPALSVVELMRILLDEYHYEWHEAWKITRGTMAYTNHTLLPEALETWSIELFQKILPRHLMIINEINHRLLQEVRERYPDDWNLVSRVSIYEEGHAKRVRMAHLAVAGSFSVNGVAKLHTELLKTRVMPDFFRLWPERFNNKTNGITQRRWLLTCNPALSELITSRIGDRWCTELQQLERLDGLADDAAFRDALMKVKRDAKTRLCHYISRLHGVKLNPHALFDIQIKRIHEYKRQLLNALHIVHLYLQIKRNPHTLRTPRTFIFGGKAAPAYTTAKLIIQFINCLAKQIGRDRSVAEQLQVFFFPNYNVTGAEVLFPAADVSEQISTAGFEASGTGNMKFALNGALTIGTLDGANVEIAREVGLDNIFIFGKTVEEVAALREHGYTPREFYENNVHIREVLDLIRGDFFNPDEPGLFHPLVDALLNSDYYLLLADFESYRETHLRIDQTYADPATWSRMAVHNIARMGNFSSDRTIEQYAQEIWRVRRVPIELR